MGRLSMDLLLAGLLGLDDPSIFLVATVTKFVVNYFRFLVTFGA